jgi:hypothetical protein
MEVNKRYWINPSMINFAYSAPRGSNFRLYYDRGRIKGGNWDRLTARFENLDVFHAIKERFVNGKPWNETEFYHRVLREIGKGYPKWKCRSKEDFNKRCKVLDELFEDIKHNGYRSQADIMQHRSDSFLHDEDEINVYIDRDGQLLLGDGRHRLAIAKVCGINRIAVKVAMRHSDWYRFWKKIMNHADLRLNGRKANYPWTHPDLQDIPSFHDETIFEIIKSHVPAARGDLLDISDNWGYYCHRFEQLGFNCYAAEVQPTNLYFLKKLRNAENRKFHVITRSIFDYHEKTHYDLVLALNVLQHFLKTKQSHEQLIDFLERVDTKFMFFQAHLPWQQEITGSYRNYECDEFANFISRHSRLKHCTLIGEDTDGRPIYKLWK